MIGRLACRMGRHAPEPGGVWNGGYCFTRCRRCARDMVRSAFGEWHVPKDFRIVWSEAPPADLDMAMAARAAPPPPADRAEESPIAGMAHSASPFDFSDFDDLPVRAAPYGPDEPQPPAVRREAGG